MIRNQQKPRIRPRLERWTENAINWVGSKNSVAVHTIFFVGMFVLIFFGVKPETVLLVLTTIVSLEAIYLAIFIQMTVNKNTQDIEVIQEDMEEIQEDVEEIQEDVEEIQKDVDEIQEDVEGIEKDVDEIQEDVEEIQEDVDEIQEDMDEIQEDIEEVTDEMNVIEAPATQKTKKTSLKSPSVSENDRLTRIEKTLEELLQEIRKQK